MKYDKIPSINECYAIMQGRMLPHIKEHSEQVMRVALAIINDLIPSALINKNLVMAGSLLHDITKTESLRTKERHDITGAILIRELGYHNVADIIEEHVELKNYDLYGYLQEKEIVFYADKRVMHNKIVTLEERISDLLVRYGKTENRRQYILKNKEMILDIEKKINNHMTHDINAVIFALNNNN